MSEKPILFSTPMVRAILEGRKTQTRRIIKPQPYGAPARIKCHYLDNGYGFFDDENDYRCPFGQINDRLWVRETWQEFFEDEMPIDRPCGARGSMGISAQPDRKSFYYYRADGDASSPEFGKARWIPSIHMPRWASRINLEITDIRVERLQDISESDAEAEGVERNCIKCDSFCPQYASKDKCPDAGTYINYLHNEDDFPAFLARESFESLWKSINGAESWNANPWVWVISFKKIEGK